MESMVLDTYDPKTHILIKGARLHNLKNVDLAIPHKKLIVITGLSGSGKSSLAFDTLYAEGQRRYIESLSAYARQFLGKLDKPKVDYIKGVAPAIAVEQKVSSNNPRSTVGTSTEIYDYLKLMYARAGRVYSAEGKEVKKHSSSDIVSYILSKENGCKLLLLSKIDIHPKSKPYEVLQVLKKQGFLRIFCGGNIHLIEDFDDDFDRDSISLVIDRIVVRHNDRDFDIRISDSVETALDKGKGKCFVYDLNTSHYETFSNKFDLDGVEYIEPSTHLFSFNNSYGACPTCEGYGSVFGIDEHLVVPNRGLSVHEGAIAPWKSKRFSEYLNRLEENAYKFEFPIHKPWFQLSAEQRQLVWDGNEYFDGLNSFFERIESKNYKLQNKILLSRYRGKSTCKTCKGSRLRHEAGFVEIGGRSICNIVEMPLCDLVDFFRNIELNEYQKKVTRHILKEIINRINFLTDVGLGYLTLNRRSNTLSGGESQRVNLATSLGSSLVGSMYILDEPSIGLHSRDSTRLIKVLRSLCDIGNTVIIVEHDETIMNAADIIIDMGPEAGVGGGEVTFIGNYEELKKSDSLTAKYLNGSLKIDIPKRRRPKKNVITIVGACEHNIRDITVDFPLDMLTVVTGVSGSGKSTLVKDILYPSVQKHLRGFGDKEGLFKRLDGSISHVKSVEYIDQNPIGRSSRSNPATYIKVYDDIRKLFALQKTSRIRGYKAKHFSFNIPGGRCETCLGEGKVVVEMQFMADVHLECEDCRGKRFMDDVLEIEFCGKNISDILRMTIDEAIDFFEDNDQTIISNKLKPLRDVGMGYVMMGQSSSTLSGGEAQRVKLALFLSKNTGGDRKLFIFDEPTTGLHFHDIKKLIYALNALIDVGHSVIVVEHNMDFIKCADYVIDMGPEGGNKGGKIIAKGTPEQVVECEASVTGRFLAHKL